MKESSSKLWPAFFADTGTRREPQEQEDKAGREYWDRLWDQIDLPDPIDPRSPSLGNRFSRRMHTLFQHAFAGMPTEGASLLEIGCGRSAWLPYFHREFGFQVSGLDYSDIGCEQARQILAKADVEGEIFRADLFCPPASFLGRFDVVFSGGVVEHFADTQECISACAAFLKPGGAMVTVIPNMRGVVGALQRVLDRTLYEMHVPLRARDLRYAHQAAGLSVLGCAYFLSTGYGVLRSGAADSETLRSRVKRGVIRLLEGVSILVWWLEDHTLRLPPSRLFSPYVSCVAKKGRSPDHPETA